MYLKKLLTIIIFLSSILSSNAAVEVIEAENNAYIHNNKGLLYLKDNYYYGAIKEFQMAIDLLPNKQATSLFYKNLGTTYDKIGYPELAQQCFEKSVNLNPLSFDSYLTLAENYKKLGIIDKKITEFQQKTNSPLSYIMLGLLYIQNGNKSIGVTILDDFCDKEQNLLITNGVKAYIKEITKDE